MPKGLTPTSSQIVISFGLNEDAADTFTTERIDLQLNALDNEVFVVTGVKMDVTVPTFLGGSGAIRYGMFATLSKQNIAQSISRDLDNPSVFASANHQLYVVGDGSGFLGVASVSENNSDGPAIPDYIDIIATPDFFVNINGLAQSDPGGVAGKLYGYRAKADASTYAALVQSELLSQ